jgi:NAD(P)-dependent dehydrogenase (short-subunit alcohol dehydrogenase family)
MKIIVIGTGIIGGTVVHALAAKGHEVIGVSRKSSPRVDIQDHASIKALFEQVKGVQHVVSCAGGGVFKPLDQLTDADYESCLHDKLMGQANVIRTALGAIGDGGSITVTSGVLAQQPMPGAAAISMINAGLEGFVRGAALEAPRGIRVNVVSPPWITETMKLFKMDATHGMPSEVCARAYVAAVEGSMKGQTIDPAKV